MFSLPPVYVYKSTKKKKNQTYYFKTCIKGQQYIRRGFSSKQEAKEAEEIFRVQMMNSTIGGKKKVGDKTPIWQVLLTSYLSWIKNQVKETYYYSLKNIIKRVFIPLLPNIEVSKLTYSHFEKARSAFQQSSIATDTKNKRLSLLKRIFVYCKIYFNYECLDVQKLQPFKDYSIHKKEVKSKIITHEIFKKIYQVAEGNYKFLYLTLYMCGLRIGETLGLCVDSFDLENKIVYIYQAVSWKTGKKGPRKISPKTRSSNRCIWLVDSYIEILKNHIQKYKLKKDDYIFFSSKSKKKPLSEHAVRNNMEKIGKAIGFTFHPHMFRHTNVSELREKGLSLEDIQKLEGHSSIEITEKVYLHETEERKKRTQNVMEEILKDFL